MNDEQLLRYSRHILLDDFDLEGQEALLASSVLIVGAGGLGCPAALYLAASGVGRLLLVDDDVVELSNLQRQIGHASDNINMAKVLSLKQSILALNPHCQVITSTARLTEENALPYVAQADVVLDCSDNFTVRFLLNRLCRQEKKPLVSGAAIRSQGQVAVFDARQEDSACYACLYSEQASSEQNCAANGVLSPLVGIVGSYQASEAIKILAHYGQPLSNRLLTINLKDNQCKTFAISKDPHCSVCQKNPTAC